MKKYYKILYLSFLIIFTSYGKSQVTCPTTILYDHMEVYTWFGNWNTVVNTGFYTNVSVSPTVSGAIIGVGNGTSAIETANYVLPNVTGLNNSYIYKLKFRLGSYRISNPTAATAGVDGPDYIDVRYSINNGTSYVTEMRITGNANAYWDYNLLGVASKTASGIMTTYSPLGGGNRTSTGDGYSVIELTLPVGITQLTVQLNCRVSSAGEEWWLDDIDLIELTPCSPLPIELVSFDGFNHINYNYLTWVSATEVNNDYYLLERSVDGINWVEITKKYSIGTLNTPTFYDYSDHTYINGEINYYRLSQVDYDGKKVYFNIISLESKNSLNNCLYEYFNLNGQEIDIQNVIPGLYLRKCGNNFEKIVKIE
jgi:hypothetical protein